MAVIEAAGVAFQVWRQAPTGPATTHPVVFVHGLMVDDMATFYFTLGGIAAQHAEAFGYDLRGHGRTQFVDHGYRVADHVTDLFALLDEADLTGPVHLVANSFGGAIALRAALARPERVASLVLVEAHYPTDGWAEEMVATLELAGAQISVDGVMQQFNVTTRRKAERIATTADRLIWHSTLRADLGTEQALTADELASIRCPALCLYGAESDLVDRGRRLATRLPDAELHVFPGATHMLLIERPADLQGLLLDWLARHPVAPAADPRAAVVG
jgi:pimeloyl-ACP methyl ester carboxylesterase